MAYPLVLKSYVILVIVAPLSILVPYAGLVFSACIRSIAMSRTLHAPVS